MRGIVADVLDETVRVIVVRDVLAAGSGLTGEPAGVVVFIGKGVATQIPVPGEMAKDILLVDQRAAVRIGGDFLEAADGGAPHAQNAADIGVAVAGAAAGMADGLRDTAEAVEIGLFTAAQGIGVRDAR